MRFSLALLLLVFGFAVPAMGQQPDPFAEHIRPTDPLTPEQEQKTFRLPPGFEIQLVASEPEILKPLNLAFDAKGRLWVTETTEYPHPAPPDRKARDNIKILEDTNGDGRADKISTFAKELNIPIGLYPYQDGAIAFSIPHIWRLRDTDGDGEADRRDRLYGPMGYERDAHGLNNAFRRGFDGWLYACHGFSNETTVAGADGHEIHMQSGNTYRMRLDGSRVEQFTWGQVNPFGMTLDPLFNIFTADCHSKPLYQLLRGGYYPSFGKPHDGLGFVPPMMRHTHGSTAISGAAFYTGENFPAAYRGNLFSGNVVTCRVNRNSLEYHGSTILAKEEPDFVSTTDPWFRPVDVRVGPDGALYIADFYNRIIGHYEVDLDHPGRDRKRGRIWRVVYKGDAKESRPTHRPSDLSQASLDQLIAVLDEPNLTRRLLAMDQISDRIGASSVGLIRQALEQSSSSRVRGHALWILFRLGAVAAADIRRAAQDANRHVRVHAMKVLSETSPSDWTGQRREMALAGLGDTDAFVRRAAADALGQHPQAENIRPLFDALAKTPEDDNHLRHVIRMSFRNQLRHPQSFAALSQLQLTLAESKTVADIALAVESTEAGAYLLEQLGSQDFTKNLPAAKTSAYLRHAARYCRPADVDRLVELAQQRFAADIDQQVELLSSIAEGQSQRGKAPSEKLRQWGKELAARLLQSVEGADKGWWNEPDNGKLSTQNPWVLKQRRSADGDERDLFMSSFPHGEQLTGRLRSPIFEIPVRLRFFLAGHNGPPERPASTMNVVRLRKADSGKVLQQSKPPRNDTAQPVEWDLSEHAGGRGYLEIVDGDYRGAYAWLAVGRFEPSVAPFPKLSPSLIAGRQRSAASVVELLRLKELRPLLVRVLLAKETDAAACEGVIRALTAFQQDARLTSLAAAAGDVSTTTALRRAIAQAAADRRDAHIQETLVEVFRASPAQLQRRMAQMLSEDRRGGEGLLTMVENGQASPRLLLNRRLAARLAASIPGATQRIAELTKHLPATSRTLDRQILQRRIGFASAAVSIDNGNRVFQKQCAICHQVGGQGVVIGPQLDGVGNRGVQRLIEDLVDPNRNVDAAFRTTTLVTAEGKVLSGLFRREEGATLVFADNKGKEFRVAKDEIVEQTKASISLMPENTGKELSDQDFYDLVGYLLRQRKPGK